LVSAVCLSLAILFIGGCSDFATGRFQGYVEASSVYVASPLAGQLESLQVRRGDQVQTGDPLFALDETAEKAALRLARAALVFPKLSSRDRKNFSHGPCCAQDYDRARSTPTRPATRRSRQNGISTRNDRRHQRAGLVYDTLFRQGEWVAAESRGRPVAAAKHKVRRVRS